MAEFRKILDTHDPEPEPVKVMVPLDEETAVRLTDFGMKLSKTLGFTVNFSQAIAYLLANGAPMPTVPKAEPEPSVIPMWQNTPIPMWTGEEHDCPEWWFAAQKLAKAGSKIDAIKQVRAAT